MRVASVLLAGFLLSAIGCGGASDGIRYASVSGTVVMDNKPVDGATVSFVPKKKGANSMAVTDGNGKFSLKTVTGKNGAVVGDHDVLVTLVLNLSEAPAAKVDDLAPPQASENPEGDQAKGEKATIRFVVPERYSQRGTLTATVPSGGIADHKIELKNE